MRNWLMLLRDVVWSAVLAVLFSALAIGTALWAPDSTALVVAFGFSAVTCAGLAQRVF